MASLAPVDVVYGLTALAALGAGASGTAVASALLALMVGNLVMAWSSPRAALFSGPRPAQSVMVAALAAAVLAHPKLGAGGVPMVMLALLLATSGAGLLQWALGALRLGRAVQFVPLPVVAGITNGAALALALISAQTVFAGGWQGSGWRLLAVAVLVAVMAFSTLRGWRVHWSIVGLTLGIAVYDAGAWLAAVQPADWALMGGTLPRMPTLELAPQGLLALLSLSPEQVANQGPALLLLVVPVAFSIAAVNAIDTLVSIAHLESLSGQRVEPDRALRGIGLGNVMCGLLGGLPLAPSPARTLVGFQAGARDARGPLAGVVTAALLIAVVPLVLHWVPRLGASALLLYLAWTMIDAWTRQGVKRLFSRATPEPMRVALRIELLLMAAVAVLAVTVGLAVAITAGLAVSMFLFVRRHSRSIVAAAYRGDQRRSLVVRTHDEDSGLHERRRRILVLELDGPLFFGSADALRDRVEALRQQGDLLVLSLRQVSHVDASGATALVRLLQRWRKAGGEAFVSDLPGLEPLLRLQLEQALAAVLPNDRLLPDIDRALQAAEDLLLDEDPPLRTPRPHEAADLLRDLVPHETAAVRGYLQRQQHTDGKALFVRGEPGDALYVLVSGEVEIRVAGAPRRFGLFRAGAMFGELGLVQGQPRSADAVACGPVEVLVLTAEALARLREEHPDLAFKLMHNVARHIAQRLAVANAEWRFALRI